MSFGCFPYYVQLRFSWDFSVLLMRLFPGCTIREATVTQLYVDRCVAMTISKPNVIRPKQISPFGASQQATGVKVEDETQAKACTPPLSARPTEAKAAKCLNGGGDAAR